MELVKAICYFLLKVSVAVVFSFLSQAFGSTIKFFSSKIKIFQAISDND